MNITTKKRAPSDRVVTQIAVVLGNADIQKLVTPEETTDELEKGWVLESVQIDLQEPLEISYWVRAFRCSPAQLRSAVNEVGANAGSVRKYLQR